ncbi:hypothetical protein C8R44DRAFT_724392 [Mycena epipterygia]|nr:hypothetical protein C8R44DRAFT_724392 [Mycena epipterygia]
MGRIRLRTPSKVLLCYNFAWARLAVVLVLVGPNLAIVLACIVLSPRLIIDVHVAPKSKTEPSTLLALFENIIALDLDRSVFASPYQLATLISRFPRLEKVSFSVFFKDLQVLLSPPTVPRTLHVVHVHFLSTGDPTNYVISWLHAGEHPPAIGILQLKTLQRIHLPFTGKLLRAPGPDLRVLALTFSLDVTSVDIEIHFDLSHNTRLQSLNVFVGPSPFDSFPANTESLCALLSVLPVNIATFAIVLIFHTSRTFRYFDWLSLITALALPYLSTLQRLHFKVRCPFTDGVEVTIRARLDEHNARGVMDVSVFKIGKDLCAHLGNMLIPSEF